MKGVARLRKASVSRLAGIAGDSRMGEPARKISGHPAERREGKQGN